MKQSISKSEFEMMKKHNQFLKENSINHPTITDYLISYNKRKKVFNQLDSYWEKHEFESYSDAVVTIDDLKEWFNID